jgi:hypothetical protein
MNKKTPSVRYGVYTAEGKLLGTWALRSEAQLFLHPGLGREVRQIGLTGAWPTVSAEQYRRDKEPKAIEQTAAHHPQASNRRSGPAPKVEEAVRHVLRKAKGKAR